MIHNYFHSPSKAPQRLLGSFGKDRWLLPSGDGRLAIRRFFLSSRPLGINSPTVGSAAIPALNPLISGSSLYLQSLHFNDFRERISHCWGLAFLCLSPFPAEPFFQ